MAPMNPIGATCRVNTGCCRLFYHIISRQDDPTRGNLLRKLSTTPDSRWALELFVSGR